MKYTGEKGSGRTADRAYPSPNDFIALLLDGDDPASVAYVVPLGYSVIDMKVRPLGSNEGNVVVMAEDTYGGGHLFVELERTAEDTFAYVQSIADGGMMPLDPRAFTFSPEGIITIIDYSDGLHYVDEDYGYVWGFGATMPAGMFDITIDSDGYIYLANIAIDRVRRYTNAGLPASPVFGSDLTALRAITVAGFTPTPVGENVLVEPWENVEVTFEGIAEAGFTTAVVETSSSRVSPGGGNYLPWYAALPGSRADEYTYISLATDAVDEDVMQVDVLLEGSRLFFASGYGDTFRDFTVTGSIEDARGTIPRFSEFPTPIERAETDPTEVVLVEDTRDISEVIAYKVPGGSIARWRCPTRLLSARGAPYGGSAHSCRTLALPTTPRTTPWRSAGWRP